MAKRRPTVIHVKTEHAEGVRELSLKLGLKWIESPSPILPNAILFKWMMKPDQEHALIFGVPREAHALSGFIFS